MRHSLLVAFSKQDQNIQRVKKRKKEKRTKHMLALLSLSYTTKHVQICGEKHLSQAANRQILIYGNYIDDICLLILQLVQEFVD